MTIHNAGTFNMPTVLYTNSGCGRERRMLIGLQGLAKAAPVWNYVEVYWPCAGELSVVNAIGTQLRDPINSGLTRWCMAVYINKWTPSRNSGGIPLASTRFSLSMYGDEQADVGRDCRIRLARPNSQARTGTGKYSFLPCSADHVQDW